jgi:hypothetical protein
MGEIGIEYKVLQRPCEPDTISQGQRPLSTRNLDELERELAEIERKLLPLLNTIRAMRGEKPVFVPKDR